MCAYIDARRVLTYLDEVTNGPKSFSRLIGEQLKKFETMPIEEFKPIECILPEIDEKDLSIVIINIC